MIGLDCEWASKASGRVAILQISNGKMTLVVQMLQLETIPKNLQELLVNPQILKTGVGILQDAQKLLSDYALMVDGVVELGLVAGYYGTSPLSEVSSRYHQTEPGGSGAPPAGH